MDFDNELPCGGYQDQDKKIQKQLKNISEGKECSFEQCQKCDCKVQEIILAKPNKGKKCKKCVNQYAVLLQKGQPVCQDCLFKNMEYKLRLTLQNTFKISKTSNLLLCLSGGLNSIAMIHLFVNIMKRYQRNKLFNKLGCIHIKQQQTIPENYLTIFKQLTGIQLVIINISQVYGDNNKIYGDVKDLIGSFNKVGNTIDLITIFRDRLILEYAKKNDYHYVFKAFNGESLATESFKYFAKGLGGNIPNLCTSDTNKGPFYYPLRTHLQKELQYYYYKQNLAKLAIKFDDDNIQNMVSSALDDQIKKFVLCLQQMYSHTAPAIVRTAQKIETILHNFERQCKWCWLPGAQNNSLCRRCNRIWQSRKKTAIIDKFPKWMNI